MINNKFYEYFSKAITAKAIEIKIIDRTVIKIIHFEFKFLALTLSHVMFLFTPILKLPLVLK